MTDEYWPPTNPDGGGVACDRCGRGYRLDGAALAAFESAALAALDEPNDEGWVCGDCREVEFNLAE